MENKIKSRKINKSAEKKEEIVKETVSRKKTTIFDGIPEKNGTIKGKNSTKVKSRKLNIKDNYDIIDSDDLKKISNTQIRKSDKIMEKEAINEENISIISMILIAVGCLIVGFALGYILYKLALNSSNSAIIIRNFFK